MAYGNSVDQKLRHIDELINAGQKKEARRLLREILTADSGNLPAWELLWRVVYNVKEELICLNHILGINPNHAAAKRRLNDIQLHGEAASNTGELFDTTPFIQNASSPAAPVSKPAPRRKKQRVSDLALYLFLLFFPVVCASCMGFVFYRAGYLDRFLFSSNLTATAIADKNASCRALIEKAMQVSGSYCDEIGSNKACYGNNTIKADLVPDTLEQFSRRGDIVGVEKVLRISASPLKLGSDEWGVAVLKVIANLPRSQPGQTVTMIVFGNTTLDNTSGNLETFFFSSELGQIVCEKVPDDGIMISVPEGEGVRFTVNGADLTLMGDATLKAVKNGKMEVSLFEGSGLIVSDGQEQYIGAGQQVNVQLGGESGTDAVGAPSAPEPLSQDDMDTACALTGQYCSPDQITPVPNDQVQQTIQAGLGITPTVTATSLPTFTLIPTVTATQTILFIPSWTPSSIAVKTNAPVSINTATKARTPTRTPSRTPVRTLTRTPTRTLTRTPTRTITPGGPTLTPTRTFTATLSPTPTLTPTITNTPTETLTPTNTATTPPTATNTPITGPACTAAEVVAGTLTDSGNSLVLDLTNNSGGTVTIDAMHIVWNEGNATMILDQLLDGSQIGNANDMTSPSDFPFPNPFNGVAIRRDIESDGIPTETLTINFQDFPTSSGYTVQLHFDIGCKIIVSK